MFVVDQLLSFVVYGVDATLVRFEFCIERLVFLCLSLQICWILRGVNETTVVDKATT